LPTVVQESDVTRPSPPALRAAVPGTSTAFPQMPFVSSATKACRSFPETSS
jgi:hypothetical protein